MWWSELVSWHGTVHGGVCARLFTTGKCVLSFARQKPHFLPIFLLASIRHCSSSILNVTSEVQTTVSSIKHALQIFFFVYLVQKYYPHPSPSPTSSAPCNTFSGCVLRYLRFHVCVSRCAHFVVSSLVCHCNVHMSVLCMCVFWEGETELNFIMVTRLISVRIIRL